MSQASERWSHRSERAKCKMLRFDSKQRIEIEKLKNEHQNEIMTTN